MDLTDYKDIALEHNVLPLDSENGMLRFGVTDPDDTTLKHQLEFLLGKTIRFEQMSAKAIREQLREQYGASPDSEGYATILDTEALRQEHSASRIVQRLIDAAIANRASDIHIEPRDTQVQVRFRIDGVLNLGPEIPPDMAPAITSHIKVLANLDIAEKRRPQDGKFQYNDAETDLDIRVSTVPTVHGEKLVLRLLNRRDIRLSLDSLGLAPEEESQFRQALESHQGIILVTGPTGSGKTTTLYSALNYLNRHKVNIMTVEDPIEYQLEGLNQTQVHPSIGYTFANALRSFLRQDPDIIFVGEIRDTETAQIAIRASLTGHLVFSTIHTNNALDTVTRLIDMGVKPFLLASSVKLIIAQRLVRTLCPRCGGDEQARESCTQCKTTGFVGRTGLFELLPITEEIQGAIHDNAPKSVLESLAQEQGYRTLDDAGQKLIERERTTQEEVYRVLH